MNSQTSFYINCKNAIISPNGGSSISVNIEDCEKSDLLELCIDTFRVSEIISSIDEDEILDNIGVDAVKKYFGLTEETE